MNSRIAISAALGAIVLVPLAGAVVPTSRQDVPGVVQASHDDCASPLSYHASQVEPSSAAHGSTVVATFQVGRVYDGGSCDIGWARTTDGRTWQHGLLPLTVYGGQGTTDAGPLTRASDPSVAYDEADGVWLIDSLGLAGNADVPGIFVNRSTDDGLTWGPPIATHVASGDSPDKNWITCDNWQRSAGYGNCYEEYDDSGAGDQIKMQRSTDGGLTWSPPQNLANGQTGGIGGVPVVQPPPPGAPSGTVCGRVVVPIQVGNGMGWYTSTDCGVTWSAPTQITPNMTATHTVAGGLRTSLLPASAVDGGGAVYAVWQTRSFRAQNTTLATAASAGDTCVRLVNITGLAAGQTLRIDPNGQHPEVVTVQSASGTACGGATGATFTPALAYAHASGAFVTKNNVASNSSVGPERHRAERDAGADRREPESELRRAGPDPDRGRQRRPVEHERPLHPRHRGRPGLDGSERPPRALLLHVPGRGVPGLRAGEHLHREGRLRLLGRRRRALVGVAHVRRDDDGGDPALQPGADGRRLRDRDRLRGRPVSSAARSSPSRSACRRSRTTTRSTRRCTRHRAGSRSARRSHPAARRASRRRARPRSPAAPRSRGPRSTRTEPRTRSLFAASSSGRRLWRGRLLPDGPLPDGPLPDGAGGSATRRGGRRRRPAKARGSSGR